MLNQTMLYNLTFLYFNLYIVLIDIKCFKSIFSLSIWKKEISNQNKIFVKVILNFTFLNELDWIGFISSIN